MMNLINQLAYWLKAPTQPWTSGSLALGMVVSVAIAGCASPPPIPKVDAVPLNEPSLQSPQSNPGQSLPISASFTVDDSEIQLEVAETRQQQAIGLMFRETIPDDRGMLFVISPSRRVQFWMRNVQVPLDMVFLRNGQVVAIAPEVPPCTTPTCPTYGPDEEVDQVIELRGGRAAELGLQVGDSLAIDFQAPAAPAASSP
ncbi:MAG: DUF192 domain-containing protein [Synechococcales bacterium]|nr:DUF192 domain-containing protein [Synechococcales bacterium]